MEKLLQDIFDLLTPEQLEHYREFYDRMERQLPFEEFTARLYVETLQVGAGLAELMNGAIK